MTTLDVVFMWWAGFMTGTAVAYLYVTHSHTTQDHDHGQQAKEQGGTEACD